MYIDTDIHKQKNGKFFSRVIAFDRVCYKLIKIIYTGTEGGYILKTPFVGMNIIPDKEYQSIMFEQLTHNNYTYYGFHTFDKYEDAVEYNKKMELGANIFKAIIPRGGKYYHLMNNMLVSNKIILKEQLS